MNTHRRRKSNKNKVKKNIFFLSAFVLLFAVVLNYTLAEARSKKINTSKLKKTVKQSVVNKKSYSLNGTTYISKSGLQIINNVNDTLVVVNKERNLPSNYIPKDLATPDVAFSFNGDSPRKKMRREASDALEDMFKAAKKDEIYLYAVSGYRSYSTQKSIYNRKVNSIGKAEAGKYVALPGQSEHQTGLAMDITGKSVSMGLSDNFANTKEGKWVKDNCYKFGFIIRYPKGKEDITGYNYEPWHIRYVGKDVAKKIYSNNITLEEFFN